MIRKSPWWICHIIISFHWRKKIFIWKILKISLSHDKCPWGRFWAIILNIAFPNQFYVLFFWTVYSFFGWERIHLIFWDPYLRKGSPLILLILILYHKFNFFMYALKSKGLPKKSNNTFFNGFFMGNPKGFTVNNNSKLDVLFLQVMVFGD